MDAVPPQAPAIGSDVPYGSYLRAGQSAALTFTFAEPVAGFDAGDVYAYGGTVTGFSATADPRVYTATFAPAPDGEGEPTVTKSIRCSTARSSGTSTSAYVRTPASTRRHMSVGSGTPSARQ